MIKGFAIDNGANWKTYKVGDEIGVIDGSKIISSLTLNGDWIDVYEKDPAPCDGLKERKISSYNKRYVLAILYF